MNEAKLKPDGFVEYKRLSATKLLAEASSVEVAGHTFIIAAANRPTLLRVLSGIAPDINWDNELFAPASIAFLKLKEPASK